MSLTTTTRGRVCRSLALLKPRLGRVLAVCVAVLWSAAASAQTTPKVTVDVTDAAITGVFDAIKAQTGLSMVYNVADVDPTRRVSLRATGEALPSVLDRLFAGTGVGWTISGSHIVLAAGAAPSSTQQAEGGRKRGVSGRVVDSRNQPLIGAMVVVVGTSQAAMTGLDGDYNIPQAGRGDVLEFSYVGHARQSATAGDGPLDVVLVEDDVVLDQVVVTALGIKKEVKSLTYNVQEVAASTLTQVSDANLMNTLTGKIAGIQINASSSGIGGSTRVVMRGSKSLVGNNNALYVVDGVPMPSLRAEQSTSVYESPDDGDGDGISLLNPEDIESMSVLNGAAAAALYGTSGANGVILVTTKRGREGKVNVSYSNSTTFMSPFVMPRFQNTYGSVKGEYMSWGDKLPDPSGYNPADFFRTSWNETNSVSVSTGNEWNRMYASAAAVNAAGIVDNNNYNRYNLALRNSTTLIKDRLTLDTNVEYVKQYGRNMLVQGQYHNPLIPIYLFPRSEDAAKYQLYERYNPETGYKTQFWPFGDLSMGAENPWWIINRELFEKNRERYTVSGTLKLNITDWLSASGRARIDNTGDVFTRKIYASSDQKYASEYGNYLNKKESTKYFYGDAMLNADWRGGKFSVQGVLGASIDDTRDNMALYEGHLAAKENLFTYANIDKTDSNTNAVERGGRSQWQSVFATAQVGYDGMVYLDLTARNDWCSPLAFTDYMKSGFFYPSVGLSAVVSEMADLRGAGISFLKWRGSYSEVGNFSSSLRYITKESFQIHNGQLQLQSHYPAKGLRPERTKAFETGINARFLGSRVNLDVTYYNSNTYDQVFRIPASAGSGYSFLYINSGRVNNYGIEATLGYKESFGKFRYETSATWSMNRNRIKELIKAGVDPTTGEWRDEITEVSMLDPVGSYWVNLTKGGSMGDIYVSGLATDSDGNVKVDPFSFTVKPNTDEATKWIKAGSVDPKHRLGWSHTLSYGDVSLSFLVDARIGGIVVSSTQAIMDRYGVSKASADARDAGGVTINGGKIDAQSYYSVVGGGINGLLANYVYKADNVRLREASISYALPSKWFADRVNVNVSLVGRNLWMIYNKAPFDPELTASTGTYFQGYDYFMQPSLRSLGFSVRVNF